MCIKYGLSISHEDCHGAFVIDDYNEDDMEWLMCASIEKEVLSIINYELLKDIT